MQRKGCGCGVDCGNRLWDSDTLMEWSAAHAARLVGAPRTLPPPPLRAPIRRRLQVADPIEALVAGRTPREYGKWLGSRWRGSQSPCVVGASNTGALRNTTSLVLGHSPKWGPLIASLPKGQRPVTPASTLIQTLFFEHDPATFAWQLGLAESSVRTVGSERPGLFWRGPTYPHRAAWSWGVWRARGPSLGRPLVLGPMPGRYADQVQPDRSEIRTDGDGLVRLGRVTPLRSWSSASNHALEQALGLAVMADYHLWWAHRLESYYHTDSKSPWDLMLSALAARAGLRWVDRLAAEVRHLDGHEGSNVQSRGAKR